MKKITLLALLAIQAAVPSAWAEATLASLKGTYTFQGAELNSYYIETNSKGQQVGFCNGFNLVTYSCSLNYSFNQIQGTLISDGAGHITSGSFTVTGDPNSNECNPSNNPTTPCPVVVPSGNAYSATESYAIGATVDFTVGSVTKTFQAVKANKGRPPNWKNSADLAYICTNTNFNTCLWTHVPESLTGGPAINATFTGTYTIGANGSGVITLTLSCGSECGGMSQVTFIASPTSQIGQSVSLLGIPTLANSFNFTGSAIRVK